jgi:hypothetical protein
MNTIKSVAAALVAALTINATALVSTGSAVVVQAKYIGMSISGAGSANCKARLRIIVQTNAPGMVPLFLQKEGAAPIGPIWLEAKTNGKGKHVGRMVHYFPVVGPHNEKYRLINGGVSSKWAKYKSKNC